MDSKPKGSTTLEQWLAQAAKLVDGLRVPSEIDAPLVPVALEAPPSPTSAASHFGRESAAVERETLEEALGPLAREEPWFDEAELGAARRFGELLVHLQITLIGVTVHRVGAPEIDVLIAGELETGEWVGLTTRLVET